MASHFQTNQIQYSRDEQPPSTLRTSITVPVLDKHQHADSHGAVVHLRPQQRLQSLDLTKGNALMLAHGLLAIDATVSKGQRQILDFLLPGDVLPTIDASLPKAYSVRAITKSIISDCSAGEDCAEPANEYWSIVSRKTQRQLSRANLHLLTIGYLDTAARVASFLLSFSMRCRSSMDDGIIKLPMSRNDIADYLAINRDTLSRNMSRLEALGVIDRTSRNTLRILDYGRLKDMTPLATAISESHLSRPT